MAMARPMPRWAPVTSTTFPAHRPSPFTVNRSIIGAVLTLPADALILAVVVVFVGYVVFGVTGFGASPITVPLLAHVLPLTFVLPLAGILDLASALALGVHTRRQADRRELLVLIP